MKIAINFGDNDFGNCFRGVLTSLIGAYRHYGGLPEDKEKLCTLINEISYGCYLLYQNQFDYDDKDSEHTRNYLKITSKNLLLGEEIDLYMIEGAFGNSEMFILDTDLDYPGSYPVYTF